MKRTAGVTILLVLLISGAYLTLQASERIGSSLFGALSFGTLGSVAGVAAVWHLLHTKRKRIVAAYALVAVGAVMIGLSSLHNNNLTLMLSGAPPFVVGALMWAADVWPTSRSDDRPQSSAEHRGE